MFVDHEQECGPRQHYFLGRILCKQRLIGWAYGRAEVDLSDKVDLPDEMSQ